MKKYVALLSLLSFLFIGCNGDDENAQVQDDPEVALVDKITLDFQQITTPASGYNPGNYSVWFSLLGNKMIYANSSNTPEDQFMTAYSIPYNSFSNLAIHDEVCACGYSSKFVNDGTHLFYIANEAWKFNISTNSWSELSYPQSVKNNNGEAGILYAHNRIYFLGGREATTKFKFYDISSDSWFNSTDYIYSVGTPDLAALNNRIYALGGESTQKRFSYFEEGAGWQALPDLDFTPQNSYGNHTVASFGNRFIFALTSNKIQIFDTVEEKWADLPISSPVTGGYANLFSDNNHLYIGSKSNSNEFQLYKITVSMN
jgi:hypothetical protein